MSNTQIQPTKLTEQVLNELAPIERQLIEISSGSKRFADFHNEDKKELAKVLNRLSYFVGIKEAQSIEQLKMLVPFVVATFPNNNLQELEHAFTLYCGGKLEQFEHYQNFSPMFIAKVLKQYNELQTQAKYKAKKIGERIQDEAETAEKAKQYNPIESAIESLLIEYENYSKNKYDDPDDIQKYKSYFCLKVCHSAKLFMDVPCDLGAIDFLKLFFLGVMGDNYEQKIRDYVRTNGKVV